MAYSGSTALSSVANPPVRMAVGIGSTKGSSLMVGNSRQWWSYNSTNLTTDLVAANFFTDGYTLGMRPGDIVMGVQYTSEGSSYIGFQGVITSASTAGARMSTGSLISSTFN